MREQQRKHFPKNTYGNGKKRRVFTNYQLSNN